MVKKFKSKVRVTAYKVLPTDMMVPIIRKLVDEKIQSVKTGDDAKKLSLATKDGWQIAETFLPGSVVILKYRGVEVCLFYKRQVIAMESDGEADPIPPCALKDPQEAWTRLDFLNVKSSAHMKTPWFIEKEDEFKKKIDLLEGLLKAKTTENTAFDRLLDDYTLTIAKLNAEISQMKAKAAAAELASVTVPKKARKAIASLLKKKKKGKK